MHRFIPSFRQAARSDAGASMVELTFQLMAAFVLVGLAIAGFTKVVAGGSAVPLEQCIEHTSCTAAAQAHGL